MLTSRATEILDAAPNVTVGVLTKRGPHTTPELFAVSGGRLWCLTAATTVKAKLLADGGAVAFAATTDRGAVVGIGRGVVVDPTRPIQNVRSIGVSVATPAAMSAFALQNVAELSGAALDLLAGRLGGPLPPRRVALCIEPSAVAVVDGVSLVEEHGWPRAADTPEETSLTSDGEIDVVDAVPDGIRDLAADGPAAVGWTTGSGSPLVLPAVWDHAATCAKVPAALFELVGAATRSPVSVTRDRWTGFGPTGKEGLMMRGTGIASREGETQVLAVVVDGVAYWEGIDGGHADAVAPPA